MVNVQSGKANPRVCEHSQITAKKGEKRTSKEKKKLIQFDSK